MMDGEEEVIFFMCRLCYFDISEKYINVLNYCMKYSDSFSVITILKKPYSKNPPICEHDKVLTEWNSCLLKQIIGIKKWAGTVTKDNHKVMNIYNSRKFRKEFLEIPNFFSPIENRLPEDICFYRNSEVWFATISHEKIAFMSNATKDDKIFLQKHGIRFYE